MVTKKTAYARNNDHAFGLGPCHEHLVRRYLETGSNLPKRFIKGTTWLARYRPARKREKLIIRTTVKKQVSRYVREKTIRLDHNSCCFGRRNCRGLSNLHVRMKQDLTEWNMSIYPRLYERYKGRRIREKLGSNK